LRNIETALNRDEYHLLQNDLLIGKKGITVEQLVKARVNQSLFRKVIIGNYYNACAICKLDISNLLVASHILKWSENEPHRLNPQNGICLCNTHDRAFELGYIGITTDYTISISAGLTSIKEKETFVSIFQRHENQKLNLPDKFYPSTDFLLFHYTNIFKG
jgi:putative restriction endonuclease